MILPFQTEMCLQSRELATDTRNESYLRLDEGNTEFWHKKMINAYLNHGNLCDHQMSKLIGLPIHLVSARRNDLMKLHYVDEYGFMVVKAKDENDVPLRHKYTIFGISTGKIINSSGQIWKLIKL